jgi:hypothetical protein
MLVTFSCPAYADITMFGDVAVHLLKLMGHTGTVPSALLADDVGPALARLEAALASDKTEMQFDASPADDDDEPPVGLDQRAFPLLELLKAATNDHCNVMWDKNT